MHLRLSYRLRVDRRKRYVGKLSFTCGQKTLYTFTNVNVYVREGPKLRMPLSQTQLGIQRPINVLQLKPTIIANFCWEG